MTLDCAKNAKIIFSKWCHYYYNGARILDDMGEGLESQISIFGLLSGEEVLALQSAKLIGRLFFRNHL